MARWQSGDAAACKAADLGSIPGLASSSNVCLNALLQSARARMAE